MKSIWMAALVAAVGCGGTSIDPGDGTGIGSSSTCTVTLTGAISASNVPCLAIVGYDSSNGRGSIGVALTSAAAGVSNFAVAIITAGQPATTTYTAANSVSGSNMAVASSSSEWVAVGGASAGSFSFTLNSMSNSTTSGTQTIWATSHGTATGAMQAVTGTGASGTINASVTF